MIGRFLNELRYHGAGEALRDYWKKDGTRDSRIRESFLIQRRLLQPCWPGNAVLFADGLDFALKIGSKGYPGSGVQKAESEKVLRGSREAFLRVRENEYSSHKKADTQYQPQSRGDCRWERVSHTMTAHPLSGGNLVYPPFLQAIRKKLAWDTKRR